MLRSYVGEQPFQRRQNTDRRSCRRLSGGQGAAQRARLFARVGDESFRTDAHRRPGRTGAHAGRPAGEVLAHVALHRWIASTSKPLVHGCLMSGLWPSAPMTPAHPPGRKRVAPAQFQKNYNGYRRLVNYLTELFQLCVPSSRSASSVVATLGHSAFRQRRCSAQAMSEPASRHHALLIQPNRVTRVARFPYLVLSSNSSPPKRNCCSRSAQQLRGETSAPARRMARLSRLVSRRD